MSENNDYTTTPTLATIVDNVNLVKEALFGMYMHPNHDLESREQQLIEANQTLVMCQWAMIERLYEKAGNVEDQIKELKEYFDQNMRETFERDGLDIKLESLEDAAWFINLTLIGTTQDLGRQYYIYQMQQSEQEHECSCGGGCGGCGCGE